MSCNCHGCQQRIYWAKLRELYIIARPMRRRGWL